MIARVGRLGTLLVVAITAIAVFTAGMFFTGGGPVEPAEPTRAGTAATAPLAVASAADLDAVIASLQERLEEVPGDHSAWASLGTAYVQQTALTGDPSFYPRAEDALGRSLELEGEGNAAALTGLAALAAGQHDFVEALGLAREAQEINPYGAANQGVLADALQQRGRYGDARVELQRMLDLRPGVSSFTRASYDFELRGRIGPARMALERALGLAERPSDRAFCLFYLGELAWNAGDLAGADRRYREGLEQDATYTPLLAGRARVAAAQGRVRVAVDRYAEVVRRLPVPTYLIEYADLLGSLGRDEAAGAQEAVVAATQRLFEESGASVDLELSLFHADRGDADQALATARAAWEGERSVWAADAYAWALHVSGRDREALEYVEKAGRLGTERALFFFHRGVIEGSLGDDAAARRSFRRALAINPYFSPVHAPRARAALGRGARG